jgi:hypothetical protein
MYIILIQITSNNTIKSYLTFSTTSRMQLQKYKKHSFEVKITINNGQKKLNSNLNNSLKKIKFLLFRKNVFYLLF